MSGVTHDRALPISNGLRPPEGPKALLVTFQITASVPVNNYSIDVIQAGLSFAQTIMIDNSANPMPVTIIVAPIGQIVTAQANTQIILPLITPLTTLNLTCQYAGTATIPVRLINVAITPFVYSSQPAVLNISGTVNNIPAANTPVTQVTSPWVVSGTVTTDQGTSPWTISGGVSATQSGAWNVGQSGAWNVGQSGTWTVGRASPAHAALNLNVNTGLASGSGRLRAVVITIAGTTPGYLYDNTSASGNPLVIFGNSLYVATEMYLTYATGLYWAPGAGQAANFWWD